MIDEILECGTINWNCADVEQPAVEKISCMENMIEKLEFTIQLHEMLIRKLKAGIAQIGGGDY